jgi:hypothetical protein
MTHTTLGVLFRWLRARREVQERMYAARISVIRAQLDAIRQSAPA